MQGEKPLPVVQQALWVKAPYFTTPLPGNQGLFQAPNTTDGNPPAINNVSFTNILNRITHFPQEQIQNPK